MPHYIGRTQISSGNSSTTNLASGNSYTFTGSWEQTTHPDVMVNLYADQVCTVLIQFSMDGGSTVHSTLTKVTTSGINEFSTSVKGARYIRLVVSTDSLTTTDFDLQTQYGTFRHGNAPLNLPYGLDADSLIVRPTQPWLDMARGLNSGITVIDKFGRNTAVGTSYVPITLGGVYQTPQSGSATALRVKAGGSANDTAAGSGAREVTLVGLDENFNPATETLATAGASASSATTTTFTRLFRAYVSKSGTYATASAGSHTSNIVIENSAGGTDWLTIDSTNFPKGQSEVGAYSVADGYTAYVFIKDITLDTTKATDLVFFHRGGADETSAPYTAMRAKSVLIGLKTNAYPNAGTVPLGPFVGPCDIGFLGKVDSGTASVGVEFEIFLVNEI